MNGIFKKKNKKQKLSQLLRKSALLWTNHRTLFCMFIIFITIECTLLLNEKWNHL